MNYSARLVMFLRDIGQLTDAEAEVLLSAGAPKARRGIRDRKLLRHMAIFQTLLGLGAVGGGLAIQASHGGLTFENESFTARRRAAVVPQDAGYLRVVVDPWAVVSVDGEEVLTTPSARRIALTPGVHYVKFENPYFEEVQREIVIEPGVEALLEVSLEPRFNDPDEDEQ